jgi:ADP-ribose pyrophosphatase
MHEKTLNSRFVYQGRIVSLELQDVELANGTHAPREIIRHGPAVAIVAALPDGRFALVRQYRKPVEQVMLEVVAGNVEPDEPLEDAARREVREETGYDAVRLQRLGALYPSPGYVDERIEIYAAELNPTPADLALDEDEHVEVALLTAAEIDALIRAGEITDGKTLAAWLLYQKAGQPAGEARP